MIASSSIVVEVNAEINWLASEGLIQDNVH